MLHLRGGMADPYPKAFSGQAQTLQPNHLPALLDGLSDLSIHMGDSDAWADVDTLPLTKK